MNLKFNFWTNLEDTIPFFLVLVSVWRTGISLMWFVTNVNLGYNTVFDLCIVK